jgi:acyl-CoA thioesterase FadM
LVTRKAFIDWHKAAQLNDNILIETRLKYAKNSSITIEHKAYKYYERKKTNDLLVTGIVQIVAIDNNFKVKRIKSVLKNKFFLNY